MNKDLLELYSDYLLLSAFSHTTATGLSAMTEGVVSHDKVTRFLSQKDLDSRELCSEGVLYLVSSGTTLDHERIATIYQRR